MRLKRRDFTFLVGGTLASWPLATRAQSAMPVIGALNSGSAAPFAALLAAFRRGLGEAGYVEGQNLAIEYRLAEGQYDRLPGLVADLVHRRVAVIATGGGTVSALAAKNATTTIPVVFVCDDDPVKIGLVSSISRPGGNVTGIYQLTTGLEAKRLGLLHEMVPSVTTMAMLVNPDYPDAGIQTSEVQEAARALGLQLHILKARIEPDFETAFAALVQQRGRRTTGRFRSLPVQQARTTSCVGGSRCGTRNLSVSRERPHWRVDELWDPYHRFLSSGWRLHRPHSSRGAARRPAGCSVYAVRVRDQSQDC